MNYKAIISTNQNVEELYKCLLSEKTATKRAEINIDKQKDKLIIEINAKDSIALKAMLNGITKLLQTYEKVDEIG